MNNNEPNHEEEILDQEILTEDPPLSPETPEASEPQLTELEQLQNDYAALNDRYLRVVAEYDNFRKRSLKEKESIYPDAVAATAATFIPLLDTFERAMAVTCSDENYKKGIELTYNSLKEIFSKLKIEDFGAAGDLFDPNLHNAVMHCEDESIEVSTVIEVFQKGYKIGDRILRYAMVKVAN